MTKTFRTRLVLAVSALAVSAAGVVVAAQAFAVEPAVTPVAADTTAATAPDAAAAVTMTEWNETRFRGSVNRP